MDECKLELPLVSPSFKLELPSVCPPALELPPPGPGCDGAGAPEADVPGGLEYLPDERQVLKIRHRMHSSRK